jgi:hypothetical protein
MGDGDDGGDDDEERIFAKYYYTPSYPSAYQGSSALKRELKANSLKKRKKIDYWLSGEDAYTLHKPIVNKFKRRKTITSGIGQQLQADLIDVKSHVEHNDGNKFILTVIDVFSKKAWAIPVKNKSGAEIAKALLPIILEISPSYLQTDKGKEFFNDEVRHVLDRHDVTHFASENENVKASIVERFNKTLRNTMHRYFTKFGRERYIDILKDIVDAYNNRFHVATGMSPNDVSQSNQEDVWLRLYNPLHYFEKTKPTFKIGDHVRITKSRTAFQRGFTPNWSVEVFIIDEV